jgi:hypothetical protein
MDGRGSRAVARTSFWGGALSLVALALAGCSVAATPSPETESTAAVQSPAIPSDTPFATGSVIDILLPSAGPTATDPDATMDPEAGPTESPTPPLPKGTLPAVGAAPSGTWAAVNWIALPGGHYPAVPASSDFEGPNASLSGWSKGFVEFLWDPIRRTLTPWVSGSGLTWSSGPRLNLSAWTGDFKAWETDLFAPGDTPAPGETMQPTETQDPAERYNCTVSVDEFEEGPSGLLMRAHFDCEGGCGGPWYTSRDAFWTSSDGQRWDPADVAGQFRNGAPRAISGGSSGYVALDSKGSRLMTSADGRSWAAGKLPPGIDHSDPVSIDGGFVVGDVVLMQKGHQDWRGGTCGPGGPTDRSKYRGELWWSPDGITWTMADVPGTVGYGVSVELARVNDHLVVADVMTSGADGEITSEVQFVSRDGKSWTRFSGSSWWYRTILAGRDHGLLCVTSLDPSDDSIAMQTFDSSLSPVTVSQTGDKPWASVQMAIGPTGILATADGERFWIGVPSAG